MQRLIAVLFLALAPTFTRGEPLTPPAKAYQDVAALLDKLIEREVKDKRLPALSIALVDDQTVVWAKGYGFADPEKTVPATADTVYRVGSVSKLFTDLAVMQLVERGTLDLDAPVTKFLPDFKPANPFGTAITLRQLMTHRAGLVRESPIGNYFDPTEPSLAKTVESLNKTELVYAPETKPKYSNAGIAVVGLLLQETQKQAFPRYLGRTLLAPLGMTGSAFEPDPAVVKNLARATMWTYHGREFAAPTFELGMTPAGCLYSNVNDLARFLKMLHGRGKLGDDVIVTPETLETMWKLQFAKPGEKNGYGLGFAIGELDGRRRVGHGGAIYGFATQLDCLPDDKLGVVVVTSRDCANAVTSHIAVTALTAMRAAKQGKPLPKVVETTPVQPETARKLAGRYQAGEKSFDLVDGYGRLWLWPGRGGFRLELRTTGDNLIVDDVLGFGPVVEIQGEKLKIGPDTYDRVATPKPQPVPAKWAGLIGEYGWDHSTLYILEKDGKLHALIEWFFLYPLEEESADVFKFPDHGLYLGEKLHFSRDRSGKATSVEAAMVVFERRKLDGEDGTTFRIKPARPMDEVRKAAQAARPPGEKGDFRKPELVDLTTLDPTIKLDIRYASDNNFLSTPFYTSARAFMQKPAAEAVARVHKKLGEQGYGLMIFDAYRPWSVTRMFWDATPEKFHLFVADPMQGSRHNRGCAVDLTLYDRKTGKPIEMVGGFDEMSDRSYPEYPGGTSLQRWHRDLLRRAMGEEGFTVYEAEWWHFDYKDWRKYPILNLSFEEIAGSKE
jgi:serine beta-lactamase-like protein LACTB